APSAAPWRRSPAPPCSPPPAPSTRSPPCSSPWPCSASPACARPRRTATNPASRPPPDHHRTTRPRTPRARRPDPPGGPLPMSALLIRNAKVLTMDDARPRAEAVALAHGRVAAVGGEAEAAAAAGPGAQVIDAGGRTVLP